MSDDRSGKPVRKGTFPGRRLLVPGGTLLLAGIAVGFLLARGGGGLVGDSLAEPPPAAAERGGPDDEVRHGDGTRQEMEGGEMAGMEMGDGGTVRIARPVVGALGITSVAAEEGPLRRSIRSTGHVTYDETRLSTVSPKFGGWVERLHVDFTGRLVRAGEPLLEIYSPELVSAQEELLAARRLEESLAGSVAPGVEGRTAGLVESARRRLQLWDISPEQIREIEESGEIRRTLSLHAPSTGYVLEKNVDVGGRIEPGMTLYRMADLSRVWLEVEVHEQDLRFVEHGEPVEVRLDAHPGENRTGRISYVYPEVTRDTRTGRVRVDLPNPDPRRLVKPGMFATAHLDVLVAEDAVTVPRDAVMHTGERHLVFVELEPGAYEIREVEVGASAGERTQILSGLRAGEEVVARGNFIVDAESRLMETMMGQPDMPGMEMEMDMGEMQDMQEMEDMDDMDDMEEMPTHDPERDGPEGTHDGHRER